MTQSCNSLALTSEQLGVLADKVQSVFLPIRNKTVVYVDYPLHTNVGDLLIYQGALDLLKKLNCQIESYYCAYNYATLLERKIPEDWVILLHGGGNFGDIYPLHQTLRRDVVKAFPNNQIILMPQSVHFNDPTAFEEDATLYQNHRNVTIYVRDHESHEFLSRYLSEDKIGMCPDMASMLLGRWEWKKQSPDKTLVLRRRDCESDKDNSGKESGFDWDQIFSPLRTKAYWYIVKLAKLEGKYGINFGAAALWKSYTLSVLKRAYAEFEPYNTVDTDRLHGMIFSLLLGKIVVMRDNSYGKIRRYKDAWFS